MSCGQIKINSENGDAQWAPRQMKTVAVPWSRSVRVMLCSLSSLRGCLFSQLQGWHGEDGSAHFKPPQSLLFVLSKSCLGLFQDFDVQSSKTDILVLFVDLATAFIEKQLLEGPYSPVLELDPAGHNWNLSFAVGLGKLLNLFLSLLLQQRNRTYHSVSVRIK